MNPLSRRLLPPAPRPIHADPDPAKSLEARGHAHNTGMAADGTHGHRRWAPTRAVGVGWRVTRGHAPPHSPPPPPYPGVQGVGNPGQVGTRTQTQQFGARFASSDRKLASCHHPRGAQGSADVTKTQIHHLLT